ncbi:DUF3054 domain-containing protein [Nesterenkonia populi]|uniref:DUF3054 domain-containing protein n=1 Tax=Nesterenkonia populi TaxID=1591087 RepID=UPI0011BE6894|nr:DUF3054 domain-containing protein [Nesterenkonia populi]
MTTDRVASRASQSTPTARAQRSTSSAAAVFALDAVLVAIFAAVGNRSHQTGLSPADIASTAWPFLLGLCLAWLLAFTWRRPLSLPRGALTALGTVLAGMLLRHYFTDGGVQISFIVVAALSLSALLLGSRLALQLLRR